MMIPLLAPLVVLLPPQDPAPPAVVELEAVDAPSAVDHPGLRFVGSPKPLAPDAVVEDWPGFLGPRRDGRSRETRLLTEWPDGGPRLVWSMECGQGFAAPAIANGRVVYPHRIGAETLVDCLDAATGRRFWRYRFPTRYSGRYIADSGPRATPAIDGDRVYVHGVEGSLHCLELATGRAIWRRDLRAEFGLADEFFGVVSSPLVVDDLLIVQLGAPGGGPSVAAFDKRRGSLVWGAGTKWGMSCASPVVASIGGKDRLLALCGGESRPPSGGLLVLDPATGDVEFEYPFRSRTYESVLGASPVVAAGRVFLTASYNTGAAMLGLGADGEFGELWRLRRPAIEFATPLFVDGDLYLIDGIRERAGGFVCIDPADGTQRYRFELDWEETVEVDGEERELSFSIGNGCLIWADGAFFALGDYGHLVRLVADAGGVRRTQRASLFRASQSWTPPALSRGLLYVCQNVPERFGTAPPRLLCFDLRAASED